MSVDIDYNEGLVEQVAHTLDLRKPNRDALDALAKALDSGVWGQQYIADLATGVGKTYIAGALLDYLYESGVRNVVLVTPGSTIQRKTIANLTPGNPKYLRGLQCKPTVITLDTLERGEVAQALENPNEFKVFVLTVQSLLRPDTKDARRAHREHETLGQSLSDFLRNADDLVVIADEHHVYYSQGAKRFRASIDDLHPFALIGLTATPHEASKKDVVYQYPLADAIADGFVKIPVLVARAGKAPDWKMQLADGVELLNVKAAAMRSYCQQTKNTYVEPVMFVVAQTINEANEIKDILAGPTLLGGEDKVLLVTSEEPDAALTKLDELESTSSPVRAVVSVSMLKEGWDVKSIYVIASVRSMESQLLTEQILGRGLRLPFVKRTGNEMLDTVEVLSHHSFATLLAEAKVLLKQTLGERANGTEVVVNPLPGLRGPSAGTVNPAVPTNGILTPEGVLVPSGTSTVEFRTTWGVHPDQGSFDEDADEMWGTGQVEPTLAAGQVAMQFATLESRTGVAGERLAITHTITPKHFPGVNIPLYLPRVSLRWEREKFSLAGLNMVDVQALGAQFAEDEAPSLVRKALDAHRDDSNIVEVDIRTLAGDPVHVATLPMKFDTIETDLVKRLMESDAVEQTVTELNAAVAIARAFMIGANVTEKTPWRAEHGRAATAKLVDWINTKRALVPARKVVDVENVIWPEPPNRTEARRLADRQLVTSSKVFEVGYPYAGWERSIYPVNAFHAYSTEFKLAELFEVASGIKAWARIDGDMPLTIPYFVGAIQHKYIPDFIVLDDQGGWWIVEGKADDQMAASDVLAKAAAAKEWVAAVNASENVHAHWGYLLASETAVKAAQSWAALKVAGSTVS